MSPLSEENMVLLFYVLGTLSVCIMAGLFYRLSTTLFFTLFTYTFLLEQARYLNHFYLVILISFLLPFLPAHKAYSLDAKIFPGKKSQVVPYWAIFILQFQIGIVYFFGGLAKINPDWLEGRPLSTWLPPRKHLFPYVGDYFNTTECAFFVSYSGLLLDLLAFPLLMVTRSRPYIASLLLLFHLTNDRLFNIGIFPWFMIGALCIFYPCSWVSMFYSYLKNSRVLNRIFLLMLALSGAVIASWFHGRIAVIPLFCGSLILPLLFWDFIKKPAQSFQTSNPTPDISRYLKICLFTWCLLQLAIPLRHYFIPGNTSWTEEGHRFSWHMKLRSKKCQGYFFTIHEKNNTRVKLHSNTIRHWQYRKMITRPNMIIQYARHLSDLHDGAPIYADISCSLNRGEKKRLIDHRVDLTKVSFHDWKKNDWILRNK